MRAPRVQRGDAITASLWNRMAQAVDAAARAPRDRDGGITPEEAGATDAVTVTTTPTTLGAVRYLREVSRTVESEFAINPDDEAQFVEVERPTSILFSEMGQPWILDFDP